MWLCGDMFLSRLSIILHHRRMPFAESKNASCFLAPPHPIPCSSPLLSLPQPKTRRSPVSAFFPMPLAFAPKPVPPPLPLPDTPLPPTLLPPPSPSLDPPWGEPWALALVWGLGGLPCSPLLLTLLLLPLAVWVWEALGRSLVLLHLRLWLVLLVWGLCPWLGLELVLVLLGLLQLGVALRPSRLLGRVEGSEVGR